jgi:hypothetical protein
VKKEDVISLLTNRKNGLLDAKPYFSERLALQKAIDAISEVEQLEAKLAYEEYLNHEEEKYGWKLEELLKKSLPYIKNTNAPEELIEEIRLVLYAASV